MSLPHVHVCVCGRACAPSRGFLALILLSTIVCEPSTLTRHMSMTVVRVCRQCGSGGYDACASAARAK